MGEDNGKGMKTSFYVIMNRHGVVGTRVNNPQLSSAQVAIKLNLSVSDKFFERFVPETDINIADDYVIRPKIDVALKGGAMDKLIGEEK